MKAFEKVQIAMNQPPQHGHVVGNIENIKSLTKAKEEIEKMISGASSNILPVYESSTIRIATK